MRGSLFTALLGLAASVSAFTSGFEVRQEERTNVKLPVLAEATLEQLSRGLQRRQFTSVDLVRAYTARILEVNGTLNVVTEINPDAVKLARAADRRRRSGHLCGPLDGIPVLIKNNIATDDKMSNTAGSFALLGATVSRDATVAAKLRKAGAIILGKSNLSQWANYRSSNSSNGWSAYGGQCNAAYYPNQDPSGSSSGSGVSSSIGLAWAALGTETSGSILSPANVNNLVGIKPTVGLTSRHLVIPISEHQDTIGPMARTVTDAAYLLQAIAGRDPLDNYTSAIPGPVPDYVKALNPNALRGAKIGIASNLISPTFNPTIRTAFNAAVDLLRASGATIVDAPFTGYQQYLADNGTSVVLQSDFLTNLPQYLELLERNPQSVTDLASVAAFTRGFAPEEFPSRNIRTWEQALALGYKNTDPRFWAAYQRNLFYGGEGGVLGAIERQNLTAIVLPTNLSPGIPALVGSPVITVPLGFYPANQTVVRNSRGNLVATAPGVPFGISFLGKKFDESTLIGLAYAYEQKTKTRGLGKPYILPKTEIADVKGKKARGEYKEEVDDDDE
ncbi:aspartyl/glutamyl-tRNA(Asn/Gln) amidotransferase, A subunit [Sphaceloma murrayae]|uniref:Aspartyl/glutamyl-tRNA(Asn/Gln) amidotransferase, A subunit n=1 Tax=Sphaceloma murrayae TaxID=2082308 RepID=A0A2K1QMV8_9PEZI|nr:aspartyl/glutamyl-tRNA(Asn/Gln) amidotransferase, A subunit [Sphaceloma murrayae]